VNYIEKHYVSTLIHLDDVCLGQPVAVKE